MQENMPQTATQTKSKSKVKVAVAIAGIIAAAALISFFSLKGSSIFQVGDGIASPSDSVFQVGDGIAVPSR